MFNHLFYFSLNTEFNHELVDFIFSMESPTVNHINTIVQYRNSEARITLDIVIKMDKREHVFKFVVDKTDAMGINIQLESPVLGHYQVKAEVKNVDNFYQIKSRVQYCVAQVQLKDCVIGEFPRDNLYSVTAKTLGKKIGEIRISVEF